MSDDAVGTHGGGLSPRGWPNLPGYQVVRILGEGGSGRVFEVTAPGGFSKAVKLVSIEAHNPLTERELEGLRLIRTIRHPYLVSIDRLDVEADQIAIVMELADHNLREEFDQHVARGEPGIPRKRLLSMLREAAEALDLLNLKYGIQHLDVKPENLFVVADHVKVGDYGLAREAHANGVQGKSNAVTPAYAGPELFDGLITPTSDQYSLAVVYMEMLTGHRPYRTGNARQLALYHLTRPADVSPLPEVDQAAVSKALSRNPKDRFDSCTAFINTLLNNVAADASAVTRPDTANTGAGTAVTVPFRGGLRRDSTTVAAGKKPTRDELERDRVASQMQWLTTPLSTSQVRERLRAMAENWNAEWLDFDAQFLALRFETKSNWFRAQVGLRDSLLLGMRMFAREKIGNTVIEATVSYHGHKIADAAFRQYAQGVFDGMRHALTAEQTDEALCGDPREQIQCAVTLIPSSGPMRNLPVPCTGVNYSAHGLGVVSMVPMDMGEVKVRLPGRRELLKAMVVRCQPDPVERYFYLGLRFGGDLEVTESLLKSSSGFQHNV